MPSHLVSLLPSRLLRRQPRPTAPSSNRPAERPEASEACDLDGALCSAVIFGILFGFAGFALSGLVIPIGIACGLVGAILGLWFAAS